MRRRAVIAALVSLNIGYPVQARELASHAGLVASISGEEWCKEAIDIQVSAPTSNVFTGDKVTLQRLLGGVRAMLGFECPEANAIRVTGLIDGVTIYKGVVAEAAQWTLVDIHLRDHTTPDPAIPTPSQTTSTPAETEKSAIDPKLTDSTSQNSTPAKDTKEAITTCEDLVDSAKSPADYSGSIAACREALKAAPDIAEVHRLLGKAYFSNNQQTQAIPHLKIAAKAGDSESRALWGLSVIATETDRDKRSRGMDLLKAASNDGVVGASLALGLFYMGKLPPNISSVVTIDLDEARKYLNLAKAQNDDTGAKSDPKVIQEALDALQRAEQDSSAKISETATQSVDEGETSPVSAVAKRSVEISGVDAQVTALKFFEGSYQAFPPHDQRVYANQFSQSASRYVFWELNLEHPAPHGRLEMEIEAQLSDSSGPLGSRQPLKSYIDREWTWSFHNNGWGWEAPGNWQVGDYSVDLFVGGNKVARGEFSIHAEPETATSPADATSTNMIATYEIDKCDAKDITVHSPYRSVSVDVRHDVNLRDEAIVSGIINQARELAWKECPSFQCDYCDPGMTGVKPDLGGVSVTIRQNGETLVSAPSWPNNVISERQGKYPTPQNVLLQRDRAAEAKRLELARQNERAKAQREREARNAAFHARLNQRDAEYRRRRTQYCPNGRQMLVEGNFPDTSIESAQELLDKNLKCQLLGYATITDFKKTNAQEREVNGVEIYDFLYRADVRYDEEVWQSGFAVVFVNEYSALSTIGKKRQPAGEVKTYEGTIRFERMESGWQATLDVLGERAYVNQ